MKYFWVLFLGFCFINCQQNSWKNEIIQVTKSMENDWRSGNKLGIALAYTDDAYVINSVGVEAQGREEVNAYWGEFSGKPVNWTLTNYLISKDLQEIYENEKWKARKDPMPVWEDHQIQLPDHPVFQYGQSLLIRETVSGVDTSTVEFLLIWDKTDDGWKIFLDTYR
jgi:ketosteroid isomerase-like protein